MAFTYIILQVNMRPAVGSHSLVLIRLLLLSHYDNILILRFSSKHFWPIFLPDSHVPHIKITIFEFVYILITIAVDSSKEFGQYNYRLG